jgi:hypothetical protein
LAVWHEKKIPTNSCYRLHIYLHANKILIHNSFYLLDNWGKNLVIKNTAQMQ